MFEYISYQGASTRKDGPSAFPPLCKESSSLGKVGLLDGAPSKRLSKHVVKDKVLKLPEAVVHAKGITFTEEGGFDRAKKLGFFKVKVVEEAPQAVSAQAKACFPGLFPDSADGDLSHYEPLICPYTSPFFKDKLPGSYYREQGFKDAFIPKFDSASRNMWRVWLNNQTGLAEFTVSKAIWNDANSREAPPPVVADMAYCLDGIAMRCIKSCFEMSGVHPEGMEDACSGCDRGKGLALLRFAKFQPSKDEKIQPAPGEEAWPSLKKAQAPIPLKNIPHRDEGVVTVHALNDAYLEVFPSKASSVYKIMPEKGYVVVSFGRKIQPITRKKAPVYREVHQQTPSNYAVAVSIAPEKPSVDHAGDNSETREVQ